MTPWLQLIINKTPEFVLQILQHSDIIEVNMVIVTSDNFEVVACPYLIYESLRLATGDTLQLKVFMRWHFNLSNSIGSNINHVCIVEMLDRIPLTRESLTSHNCRSLMILKS